VYERIFVEQEFRLRHFSRRTTVAPVSAPAPAVDWLVELFWALQGMRSASLEGRHCLQERVELLMADARDQGHVATILAMVRAKGGGAK